VYYTDTDIDLEFDKEDAEIREFVMLGERGKIFEQGHLSYGSEQGKSKQGFAIVGIETILTKIKANPLQVLPKKDDETQLDLPEGSTENAQKEYDVYLEQLKQKDQQVSQIQVNPNQ